MTMIAVEDDFLVEHLDEMPDDGNRYELVDGLLLASPTGGERHQSALVELAFLLRADAPHDVRVYVAPLDVTLSERVRSSPTSW
jgi:hypothetical protein